MQNINKIRFVCVDNNYLKPKYVKNLLHDLMKICRSSSLTILVFPLTIDFPKIVKWPQCLDYYYHYRLQYLLWRRMIVNPTVTNVVTMISIIIHFLDVICVVRHTNENKRFYERHANQFVVIVVVRQKQIESCTRE